MSIKDAIAREDDEQLGRELVSRMATALIDRGLTPEDLGRLARVKLRSSDWQSLTKDAEGEAHIHDLQGIKVEATWWEDPKWPVVDRAATLGKPRKRSAGRSGAVTRRTLVLPDQQYGFRRIDTEMVPTHDRAAIAAAMTVGKAVKPDVIVNLGDVLDLPEWSSKFIVTPEMAETTQPAIDEAYRDLYEQASLAADVRFLEGNHDDRLAIAVTANAKAALRLRQAATTPEDWPVLSLPHLLRFDELGIDYVDGYPAGRTKLATGTDEVTPLLAVHGEVLDMMKLAKQSRQSYIQGHIHRRSTHTETYEVDGSPIIVQAFTPGCLCRVDGVVPSTKSAKTRRRPVTRWENWQQGLAVVEEYDDGDYTVEIVPIHRGRALWRGKTYEA